MSPFHRRLARLIVGASSCRVARASNCTGVHSRRPTCCDYLVPVAVEDGGPPQATVFEQLCCRRCRPGRQ